MRHGKKLIFCLTILLCACSGFGKKEKEAPPPQTSGLYQLPNKVDYEKAARLNLELALGYLKQNQIPRAKTKFLRAQNLAPQLPEVHYSYGYFLERVGEIQDAEKSYQKAISLNAKGGNEHNNYGAFLCRQRQYQKAEKEFNRAVEDVQYTGTAEALENAGLCVLQIPDVAKAADYFEKSLRYDPNRPHAMLELAIIRLQEKKVPLAQEYYNRFSQLAKPNARSLLLGIELAKNKGEQDKVASLELLLHAQFPEAKPGDLFMGRRMS